MKTAHLNFFQKETSKARALPCSSLKSSTIKNSYQTPAPKFSHLQCIEKLQPLRRLCPQPSARAHPQVLTNPLGPSKKPTCSTSTLGGRGGGIEGEKRETRDVAFMPSACWEISEHPCSLRIETEAMSVCLDNVAVNDLLHAFRGCLSRCKLLQYSDHLRLETSNIR